MIALAANLLLALVWAALAGGITLPRLAVGFLVGYVVLAFGERLTGRTRYTRKAPRAAALVLYFLRELTRANLRVAADVLTRAHRSRPGIVAVPMKAATELEIALLAGLVSLTPGTLSLEVSPDRRVLFVHAMFAADPDAVRREIQDGLERRLLEVLR